jgi:hypothetical protein
MFLAVLWFTRILAFVGSILCLYVVFCFRQEDDGAIQNRLVDLWVKVEEISTKGGHRSVAFFNQVAFLMNAVFNRIFGPQFISTRLVVVSSIFSMCSLYLMFVLQLDASGYGHKSAIVIALAFACIAAFALGSKTNTALLGAWIISAAILYIVNSDLPASTYNALAGTLVGTSIDVLFLVVIRQIVRRIEVGKEISRISLRLVLSGALGLVLLAPSLVFIFPGIRCYILCGIGQITHPIAFHLAWVLAVASATNLFAGLSALSVLIVAAVALFHRLLWPIVSRLIHVCYERKIIERRAYFLTFGTMLLGYSLGGSSWLQALLIKLARFFV